MWIFTKEGFFSAVEDRNNKKYVMVRSRFEVDLRLLLEKILGPYANHEVQSTPEADYPYRVVILKEAWAKYVGKAAMDIDYPNFKDEVLGDDYMSERSERYHDVWSAMRGSCHRDYSSEYRHSE